MKQVEGAPSIWPKLEEFLRRLYEPNEEIDSWYNLEVHMSVYTLVYEYCIGKGKDHEESNVESAPDKPPIIHGERLYNCLVSFYENYTPLVAEKIIWDTADRVGAYLRHWRRYRQAATHVESVFNYLDRYWIDRERRERPEVRYLYALLWRSWNEAVLSKASPIILAYCEGVLSGERGSSMGLEPNSTVKEVLASYYSLSTLPDDCLLERKDDRSMANILAARPFSEQVIPWYCAGLEHDSQRMLNMLMEKGTTDLMSIIELVDAFWENEMVRSNSYLSHGTLYGEWRLRVKETLKVSLFQPLLPQICEFIQISISQNEDPSSELSSIYRLLLKRKSLLGRITPSIEAGFVNRLQRRLPRVASGAKSEQLLMFISLLHAMFQEGRKIITASFDGDASMMEAQMMALKSFLTDSEAKKSFYPRLGEYLARWIDRLHRDQLQVSEESVAFVLTILKFLDERDTFQRVYIRLLSRRLLARQAFINREREETLLTPLASTYGPGYVSSLRRMLADVENSIQLTQQFLGKHKKVKLPFEISFQILTCGVWPPPPAEDNVCWNPLLYESIDSFHQFYLDQHNGRHLAWSPTLSAAEVSLSVANRTYSLIMTASQVYLLEVLQKRGGSLRMDELQLYSKLSVPTIEANLQRLIQISLVTQGGEQLSLNTNFSNPHGRINCLGSNLDDYGETSLAREIIHDRSHILQATLVRHLKKATKLSKMQLLSLLEPTFASDDIDKALAVLSDKEYLSIDADNVITYIP